MGSFDADSGAFWPSFTTQLTSEVGAGSLRFPGGITAQSYQWMRAIGPQSAAGRKSGRTVWRPEPVDRRPGRVRQPARSHRRRRRGRCRLRRRHRRRGRRLRPLHDRPAGNEHVGAGAGRERPSGAVRRALLGGRKRGADARLLAVGNDGDRRHAARERERVPDRRHLRVHLRRHDVVHRPAGRARRRPSQLGCGIDRRGRPELPGRLPAGGVRLGHRQGRRCRLDPGVVVEQRGAIRRRLHPRPRRRGRSASATASTVRSRRPVRW